MALSSCAPVRELFHAGLCVYVSVGSLFSITQLGDKLRWQSLFPNINFSLSQSSSENINFSSVVSALQTSKSHIQAGGFMSPLFSLVKSFAEEKIGIQMITESWEGRQGWRRKLDKVGGEGRSPERTCLSWYSSGGGLIFLLFLANKHLLVFPFLNCFQP